MSFHTYKIELYSKNTDGSYLTTAKELDEITNISISLISGTNADTFTFSIDDNSNTEMENIKIDDRIKIYGSLDGTNFTLIIDGIINDKKGNGTTDDTTITFSGYNRLEKLFNALVSTTGETVNKTATFWIKNIIDQVNEVNNFGGTNREITYDSNSIIETTETISFTRDFEKAFKLIEELAQPKYTGGINYVFGLDINNKFFFKPQPETVTGQLVYGTDIISHRTEKGMFDIINYIILNGGRSLFGSSILQFGYNAESISKFGWKTKLVNEGISDTIGTAEIRNMRIVNKYQEDSVFPLSYNYTTSWGVSVDSDSNYNSEFVDEVLKRADNRIEELLANNGGASYKCTVEVLPSFNYSLYNNHNLIIPLNGISTEYNWTIGVVLRILTISYTFSKDGWDVNLKLEQDKENSEGGV